MSLKKSEPHLEQSIDLSMPFEAKNFPHYDVQSSIYSLLLTALTVAVHFEKIPGFQERQRKLDGVMTEYLETCKHIETQTV